ncbi:uncharacterized protein TNIN_66911 [Trichonephila inaurata madagascariensis]|uniref:Uncharacterized protein n=1 Tax=Trichonephila inaurata madagascariensis TaxID=2747483 RepID=A0A8X7CQL4_9ARAC|nr:uncharacterized protein TNIN_66911 [Trichonephila inaurata madagascariensis]
MLQGRRVVPGGESLLTETSDRKTTEKAAWETQEIPDMDPRCKVNKSANSGLKDKKKVAVYKDPFPPQRIIRFGELTEEQFLEEIRKRNVTADEVDMLLNCVTLAWKILRFFSLCVDGPCDEQLEMCASELPEDSSLLRPRTQKELQDEEDDCVIIEDYDDDDDCLSSVSRSAKRSPPSQPLIPNRNQMRTEYLNWNIDAENAVLKRR